MPGFNTLPAVGGGGGQANMTFVASIHMNTYNRSWAQGGTAGYYAMYSTNQENGYVYFVGQTTTGGPLNRLLSVSHPFTRIDVIAPNNDMLSLYKAKVKATTEFVNPFAAFSSFPAQIRTSGNFVLPNNALPLVNAVVVGGGGGPGHGSHHHAGGGGGGGNVVKLTAFQAVGTTSVTVGAGNTGENQSKGGDTYFGNVYALGGGGGGHQNHDGGSGGNGGGAGTRSGGVGGAGTAQAASTGLGNAGSPAFHGGFSGGGSGRNSHHHRGGGGGGAGGAGQAGADNTGGNGGLGHVSNIVTGSNDYMFGAGGPSASHGGNSTPGWNGYNSIANGGHGRSDDNSNRGAPDNGAVVIRYYIP